METTKPSWQTIDKDTYMKKVVGLRVLESFSDPDGDLPFGYGKPAMDTIWGIGETAIVKCEMRKNNRHELNWEYEYFENLTTQTAL